MDAQAATKRRRVESDLASIDFFSRLPDDMLLIIISFLPFKFAFRTFVLSTRWCPLWRLIPLNLIIDDDLSCWESFRVDVMSKILCMHPGPFRLLAITPHAFSTTIDDKLREWFRSNALDGLECVMYSGGTPKHKLRLSAFRFTPMLRVLCLGYCYIPKFCTACKLLLPQLKQLELKSVELSMVTLERLLYFCIALEGLLLHGIHGFRRFCFVSQSLQDLSVCTVGKKPRRWLQDLIIQDTPCLLRLVVLGPVDFGSFQFVSAPNLKVLAYSPGNSFHFYLGVMKGENKTSMRLSFYGVKVMTIRSLYGNDISYVGQYLKKLLPNNKKLMKLEIDKDMMHIIRFSTTNPMGALLNADLMMNLDYLWNDSDGDD